MLPDIETSEPFAPVLCAKKSRGYVARDMRAARQNASIVADDFIKLDEETEARPRLPQAMQSPPL